MNKEEYTKMYKVEDTHFWFLGKRMFIDKVLQKHSRKIDKILDIGAGTGGTTAFLEKFGNVIGIEKNVWGLSLAKKRKIKVVKGEAEKLPFSDSKFDLVTVFDVLYHRDIGNEEKVLGEARRVLKRRGYILITDAAFELLRSGHDKAVHGKRRYTLSQLKNMIKGAGFVPIRSSYIFFSLFPWVFAKRVVWERIFPGGSDVGDVNPILNSFFLFLLKIESSLFSWVSYPLGSSILVLARKK